MPVCKKCLSRFPCTTKINGKTRTLHRRKFCLECSPFGLHNTRDLNQIRNRSGLLCKSCKKTYDYNKREGYSYDLCNSCLVRKRKNARKLWALQYLGGQCCVCGYNRCVNALDFHHLDSKQKKFTIGSNFTYSIENLKIELDKCVTLCSNCHREYHNGYIELSVLLLQQRKLIARHSHKRYTSIKESNLI